MIEAVIRLQKLKTFITYFNVIPGKKALQKLMYLYQEISGETLYSYQWFPYGPYSSVLEEDLQLGIEKQEIIYELEPHAKIERAPPKLPEKPVSRIEIDTASLQTLLQIYHQVKTTKNLELLASLLYLIKNHGENAINELHKRKPGKFSEQDIQNAFMILKEHGIIHSNYS